MSLSSTAEPPAELREDADWIARVRAGDEEAASALILRLQPLVLKCVRARLPRRTSEEDLVQAVFTRIFHKLHQFSGRVPLEHWVARIAVNTCLKQLEYEGCRAELRMSDLTEEETIVVQHLAISDDDLPGGDAHASREIVEKLLLLLSPDDRLVISLLHLEDWTVEEVHRLTGLSAATVKVRAFRARQKMRKALKKLIAGQRAAECEFPALFACAC
jgi:RNA polymerase sigma-70 factor (ECF subfamily)